MALRENYMINTNFKSNHNLPPQSTPFIGRVREINKIVGLIDDPACRLITLVGSGGMGKTRLALEAVRQIITREISESPPTFANGAYFIALQSVKSHELIASTIAETIGFSFRGQDNPQAQLLDYLRDRQLLLILDNFEHVLEGADLMGDILQVAPNVQLLVTSREALNLQEEWVWHVKGMRFPDVNQVDEIEKYSAIKLFIERAQRVQRDFVPEREQACIIRVCRLVGGMPLAIELAATWLKRLTCADVANEIERNLDFLTTRMRNVPERHRSMRAVFEHSWNLLEQDEREVFKQCAIFRGGFRREAAESVAGASLFTLSSLVDKSLLRVTPTGRYEIHELLRQFAEEKLDETAGAKESTHDRHCEYFADYLHVRQDNSRNAHQVEFMEEIGADIENARVAWDWAIDHKKWGAIGRALDSFGRFYEEKCWYQQANHSFAEAIVVGSICVSRRS
jgi:predicted ATPase